MNNRVNIQVLLIAITILALFFHTSRWFFNKSESISKSGFQTEIVSLEEIESLDLSDGEKEETDPQCEIIDILLPIFFVNCAPLVPEDSSPMTYLFKGRHHLDQNFKPPAQS